ncbi:P-loop NTPase fold protein [Citrobacter amalonaticus]|uniref:P-loop NTPase fold protein n=1 Tax=Citrobacter amalonaticus TaxID=35703 RepID=UPI00339C7FCE
MEYSNSNLIVKTIHLLSNKRDGLILLDGNWGTGKTYFIKNIFPNYYHINVFYYISLLGMKSLSDFKAKIIDCYYLQDIQTLQSGLESLSGIGSISSGSPASANVINNMFNSIGASVRENILSKLEGIFILDDIERISEASLANEILTYCHTLYTTTINSNLDFIIIANSSSESGLKIEHREKLISETLHYNPNPQEILEIDIIKEKLSHFPQKDKKLFEDIVLNNEIVNIRILIRMLNTITPIYEHIESRPQLSWSIPSTTVLNSMCSFFILLFLHNRSIEELLTDQNSIFSLNTDEYSDSERRLWSSLHNYTITFELKKYFSGHLSLQDVLNILFHEAKPLALRNIATSPRPELYEVNETEFSKTLTSLICRELDCDFYNWLRAVQNYEYLTRCKYLSKSPFITLKFITSILNDFTNEEIIKSFQEYELDDRSILNNGFEDSKLLFSISFIRYQKTTNTIMLHKIKRQIEVNGWASFDVDSLTTLDPFGNYKPLGVLGAPFITRCILNHWKVNDIEHFRSFLRSNYQISNIKQFAHNEKDKLIYLDHMLEIFCFSHKEGFKYGAVYDLKKVVKHAITML